MPEEKKEKKKKEEKKEKKKEKKSKAKEKSFGIDLEEMRMAGVNLGHRTSKLHPKMKDYILGMRSTIHIIDLEKTEELLKSALSFISQLFENGGTMVLVGTKPPLKRLVKEIAGESGIPYVTERWLGGTFTNFEIVSKRIKRFEEIERQKEEGFFEKFSKKERIKKEKEIEKLRKKFEGIKNLDGLPKAVFICDIIKDKSALKEANIKGIKVVAIVDTNTDPSSVDYPITANDDAITSVRYILEKVKEVINQSKSEDKNKNKN